MTDLEKIEKWFAVPVENLYKLQNSGDGAFVALAVGFMLFERYYRIDSESQDEGRVTKALEVASIDLDINLKFLERFWNVYRHGLLHQGTPKNFKLKDGREFRWRIDSKYSELPSQFEKDGVHYICLDPWKFTKMVLKKYRENPEKIEGVFGYKMGEILEEELQPALQQFLYADHYN